MDNKLTTYTYFVVVLGVAGLIVWNLVVPSWPVIRAMAPDLLAWAALIAIFVGIPALIVWAWISAHYTITPKNRP